uniref:C3H1-type domain-containing protein n=1 Tax=Ditylenchus dipsaci TaxID=166011 RepID=A0A915CQW2_9BILA
MSDERRRIFMQDKRKKSAFKTEMCKGYVDRGFCDFGVGCRFAHSQHELRLRPVHPSSSQNCAETMPFMESNEPHQLNSSAPSSRLFTSSLQQLQNQFNQLTVGGVPKQPSVPQFSSSQQQMPSCVVCSGKESGKVVATNPNV